MPEQPPTPVAIHGFVVCGQRPLTLCFSKTFEGAPPEGVLAYADIATVFATRDEAFEAMDRTAIYAHAKGYEWHTEEMRIFPVSGASETRGLVDAGKRLVVETVLSYACIQCLDQTRRRFSSYLPAGRMRLSMKDLIGTPGEDVVLEGDQLRDFAEFAPHLRWLPDKRRDTLKTITSASRLVGKPRHHAEALFWACGRSWFAE